MEHLVGASLDEVARSARGLPVAEAVIHSIQACHALAEAHARGIVHRDVKPANLFLTKGKSGESIVKVLDFGLAKSNDGIEPAHAGEPRALGTPQYMSPEQIRGAADVDARTDVWSLGATLYELLTGVPAFDAPSGMLTFARILQGSPVPVRAVRSDVSEELAAVIDRCLRRRPDERFASMRALSTALAQLPQLGHRGASRTAFPSSPVSPLRPSGEHSGGAMVVSAEVPVTPRPAPSERSAVLEALVGPGLVALAAAFMAAWMGLAPEGRPAARQAAAVAPGVVELAGAPRAKDLRRLRPSAASPPRGTTTGRPCRRGSPRSCAPDAA
jgi:serine/threonine-protein kinase